MTSDLTSAPVRPVRRPGPLSGLLAPLRGLSFMFAHPRLILVAAMPIAINTALYALFIYLTFKWFNRWLQALLPQSQAWYWILLTYVAVAALAIVLLLAIVFTFVILTNTLASPFNDTLAAMTEEIVTGRPGSPFSIVAIIKETGRTIIEELKKIILYLVVLAVLLLLNFIPVVGQIMWTVLFMLLTILWLGLNYIDYPMARHGFRLGAKLSFIRANLWMVFGYGLGLFGGLLVPILNLVLPPAAVVGGTLIFLEIEDR